MLELMSDKALEVGEARRREVAEETMRAVRASGGGLRNMVGVALVGVGRRVAGDEVAQAAAPQMRIVRDCP